MKGLPDEDLLLIQRYFHLYGRSIRMMSPPPSLCRLCMQLYGHCEGHQEESQAPTYGSSGAKYMCGNWSSEKNSPIPANR